MFTSPCVNAFSVFGFDVKMYGVMIFLAIICGVFVSECIAKKYYKDIDLDVLLDFYPVMIISGVICARLYYVLLNLAYYVKFPQEIIALWHGGISIHGAILGGFLAGIIYFGIKKLSVLSYADVVSYGLVIGQMIGRWGNFFNSEAFGSPCTLPWKLYIAPEFRPLQYKSFEYFHPTFLYESIWCFIIFCILFFFVRKNKTAKPGLIFFSYLALYSLGRFVIEGIRIDSVFNVGHIPIASIVSVVIFAASLYGVFYCTRNIKMPHKP